jgi:exodeoxyribonuclease V alpha subunit
VTSRLPELRSRGVFSALDEHFARTMAKISGDARPEVVLAAALVSRQTGGGHVCADLSEAPAIVDEEGSPVAAESWPEAKAWLRLLRESPLVGAESGAAPLVLDAAGRLYLRRYWTYEHDLAVLLLERAVWREAVDRRLLREGLDRLFPVSEAGEPDWQRVAAAVAVLRRLAVISGGPGTGKTYTVAKILALLAEQALASGAPPPRVALLAPTGKAAARLQESIGQARAGLACAEEVRSAIPGEASTIHRCLAPLRGSSTRFRHGPDHPLAVDAVVVDEASMVDLALMTRLVRALPREARLILLGDKDQLASVEAGAVLGDICGAAGPSPYSVEQVDRLAAAAGVTLSLASRTSPKAQGELFSPRAEAASPRETAIRDSIVELVVSRRYHPRSALGRLARAVNRGEADEVAQILASGERSVSLVTPGRAGEIDSAVKAELLDAYRAYLSKREPRERIEALGKLRVLCAHRRGPYGVETVNLTIERWLREEGLIERGTSYAGRPVLVTRNDHELRLYNGDVGLIVDDPGGGDRRLAAFVRSDGELRLLSPSRLPPHETAFAMSVHKSQGSEFEEVVVLLPTEPSPLVSQELLYTAITRASTRLTLHGSREVVAHAARHPISRASGLRDRLRGGPGAVR